MPLADVSGQVIQLDRIVVEPENQLVVPIANRGTRAIRFVPREVRIVKEQGSMFRLPPLQQRTQGPAIERLLLGKLHAGGVEHGCRQVHGNHRVVDGRIRLGDPRPANDQGHADPTLEHITLAGPQGMVVRCTGPPAVVTGEYHHGPIGDAKTIHLIEDPAHRSIGCLDLPPIDGIP